MPDLEYLLVAESASVDQQTNRLSVFNMIEEFHAQGFPSLVPQLVVITLWSRLPGDEDKDFQQIIRLSLPGGESKEFPRNFTMKNVRLRMFFGFQGAKLAQPGEFRVEVLLAGKSRATRVIPVTLNPKPPLAVESE
jgi:hypothetical protein